MNSPELVDSVNIDRFFCLNMRKVPVNGHVDSVLVRSRRNSSVFSPKSSACNHQIGQAKERVKSCGVLGKPTVANLLQTQQVLGDMERVFDLGPNTRFVVLNLLHDSAQPRIGQRAAFARAHRNMPVRPFLLSPMAFFNTPITRVGSRFR
jgi:hypothetical protein